MADDGGVSEFAKKLAAQHLAAERAKQARLKAAEAGCQSSSSNDDDDDSSSEEEVDPDVGRVVSNMTLKKVLGQVLPPLL